MDHLKKSEKTMYMSNRTVYLNTTGKPMHAEQQLKPKPSASNTEENMLTGGAKNVKLPNNKKWSFRAEKNASPLNTNIPAKTDKSCIFSFDNNSLLKAKEQLLSPYYLFNVHLDTNGLHGLSNENKDKLLHWQYVFKKEHFLVELPVDVDLLTYTLLEIDKEEITISIKLLFNDSNCFQNNFSEAIRSVQLLLWNELFLNGTDFYLCNRHYEAALLCNILYYLTTIWVGYDLTCSEMITTNGLHVVQDIQMKKSWMTVVTSIFCYILSLQFVWIFVLLDVRKFSKKVEKNSVSIVADETNANSINDENNPKNNEAEETIEKRLENSFENLENEPSRQKNKNESRPAAPECDQVRVVCCPEFSESYNKFYIRNDRPYGLKRFILKTLYGKCSCVCCCCKCFCKKGCFHNPTMRLLFLMWVLILLPFGVYRTIGRLEIFRNTYEYPLTVARPSEPFLHLINHCFSASEGCIVTIDVLYATIAPFFYIFVGNATYEVFLSNDMRLCKCVPEDKDCLLITNSERIDNRFTYRYSQFCRNLSKLFCQKDRRLMETNGCKWACKYKVCFRCVISCMYCIFPCIPFSCFTHKYMYIANCASREDEKKCTKRFKCCCLFIINMLCLCIVISYLICLRPIFSTFTFLFRSFTYIVFVVFPTRTYILRVTIMIVTAIIYFSNYIHEIINMNSEILNYIFKLKEEKHIEILYNRQVTTRHEQESKVENISEEDFDGVYEKLMFVKKAFYFLFLKVVIVIMYLFITFTTFIMNTKSITESDFKDILQFLLIIIGPYAIIFFLKANNSDFLTEENKTQIREAYKTYAENRSLGKCSTESSLSCASTNEETYLLKQPKGKGYESTPV